MIFRAVLSLVILLNVSGFIPISFRGGRFLSLSRMERSNSDSVSGSSVSTATEETEVTSKELSRLERKVKETMGMIDALKVERSHEEAQFKTLDDEYGSEIARVKREFARMRERAHDESKEAINAAKVAAIKDILPMTDNFARARSLFATTVETESEKGVLKVYDDINTAFQLVLKEFGVEAVQGVGQPFDFNFMEAVMMQPSMAFARDHVCSEYQIGYKLDGKSIRPAMVVVSAGPGPEPAPAPAPGPQ